MKPLAIRTYHQRRRRRARLFALGFAVVLLGALTYYLVRPSAKPNAAPLPVVASAPPTPVGVVTEIGSGAAIGTATDAAVVDLHSLTQVHQRRVAVGTFPDAVAIDSKREMAYVTNYADGTLTPISLLTGRAGRPIAAGSGPAGIAITPNGKVAYITDAGSAPLGNTVTPINLVTDRPMRAIRVGLGPQGIAITPDGRWAYVANAGAIVTGQTGAIGHTVTPINLFTNRPLAPIKVGNAPIGIAVSADGTTVFVTNSYSGSVSPISVATNTAGTPIPMAGTPQAIVNVPSSGEMLVANAATTSTDNLTLISVASETAGATIPVPKNPTSLAVTSDGRTAWVICNGINALVRINLTSHAVDTQHEISIPNGPYALALGTIPAATEHQLFVTKAKAKKIKG